MENCLDKGQLTTEYKSDQQDNSVETNIPNKIDEVPVIEIPEMKANNHVEDINNKSNEIQNKVDEKGQEIAENVLIEQNCEKMYVSDNHKILPSSSTGIGSLALLNQYASSSDDSSDSEESSEDESTQKDETDSDDSGDAEQHNTKKMLDKALSKESYRVENLITYVSLYKSSSIKIMNKMIFNFFFMIIKN